MPSAQPSVPEMMSRLRQQELLAHVGLIAIKQDDLGTVLTEACRIAALGLDTEFAKVLEYQPEAGDLLVRAGVGWRPGVVGQVRLGTDLASPAGYALRTGEPVISNHLEGEVRFRTPPLLADHGIRQAINVVIQGEGEPYGVLEADSTHRADFVAQDVPFLQALAGMLGVLIEKHARQAEVGAASDRLNSMLAVNPDAIHVLSADGTLDSANENGLAMLGLPDLSALPDRAWEALWPDDVRPVLRDALSAARLGGHARFEASFPAASGEPRTWDVRVLPMEGMPSRLIAVSRDITHAIQDARNKDLLIQEVHHRVKNSLQLVQNLLTLQARASGDPVARVQLQESAARVNTIGAIHDRLYRIGATLDVPVDAYLRGLVDDVRSGMASTLADRRVALDADSVSWPAAQVATLGLVTVELVTNALKYGAGVVTVTFRQPGAGMPVLTVEDEGTDLAGMPDPLHGGGLGMRLVQGMLRGPGAGLELDRGVRHTRFVARLPIPEDGPGI